MTRLKSETNSVLIIDDFRTGTQMLLFNGSGEKSFPAIGIFPFQQMCSMFRLRACLNDLCSFDFLRYFVLLSTFLCVEGLLDNRAWLRVKNKFL